MKLILKQLNKARHAALVILAILALQSSGAIFAMQSHFYFGATASSNNNITNLVSLRLAGYEEVANFLALNIQCPRLQDLVIDHCNYLLPHVVDRILPLAPYLLKLSLEGNEMYNLPDSIGNLTNLQELNLSNNMLTTLPDSIGQLTNLKSLNLSLNQLTALPTSIVNLTKLQNLKLVTNKCTVATLELLNVLRARGMSIQSDFFFTKTA